MRVEFAPPLIRSWNRMRHALFASPFDPGKWLAVGFAAWLAGLADGGSGGTFWKDPERIGRSLQDAPRRAWGLMESAIWVWVAVSGTIVILALLLLVLWISSRAKFVFLHDVVHDLKAIREPWRRYSREGNSLFLWRVGFAFVVLGALLVILVPLIVLAVAFDEAGAGPVRAALLVLAVLSGLVLAVAAGYTALFLDSFVVPIMYREGLRAGEAWRRFLPLLRRGLAEFFLYGLFVLVLAVGLVVALFLAGCATCCVGFFVIVVPYVGSVALLPFSYTYRAFGPEFLAQFGPEWSVWPAPQTPPASAGEGP